VLDFRFSGERLNPPCGVLFAFRRPEWNRDTLSAASVRGIRTLDQRGLRQRHEDEGFICRSRNAQFTIKSRMRAAKSGRSRQMPHAQGCAKDTSSRAISSIRFAGAAIAAAGLGRRAKS